MLYINMAKSLIKTSDHTLTRAGTSYMKDPLKVKVYASESNAFSN